MSSRFDGPGPPYGPPKATGGLAPRFVTIPPNCKNCGRFKRWICKHEEIMEKVEEAREEGKDPTEVAPPGPWGYWRCINCRGPDPDKDD